MCAKGMFDAKVIFLLLEERIGKQNVTNGILFKKNNIEFNSSIVFLKYFKPNMNVPVCHVQTTL